MLITVILWTLLSVILGAALGSTTMLGIFVHRFYWIIVSLMLCGLVGLVTLMRYDEMIATTIVCQSALGAVAGMLVAADVIIKRAK